MQEQQPEAERERQHQPDGDVALGQALAGEAHADAGGDSGRDQAGERRRAHQHRAGGAGEADMRQRVAGKGLAAQNQEIADQPGHQRDDRRRREGVLHEVVLKHRRDRWWQWQERASLQTQRNQCRGCLSLQARPLSSRAQSCHCERSPVIASAALSLRAQRSNLLPV